MRQEEREVVPQHATKCCFKLYCSRILENGDEIAHLLQTFHGNTAL